jgi:DNA-binding SARP family transcriptional activator
MSAVDSTATPTDGHLAIGLLGPLEVHRGLTPIAIGGVKQRTVLALLALNVGRVVSVDQLVDALWSEAAGGNPTSTLQVYASKLRKALASSATPTPIAWRPPGYVLEIDPECVDTVRFDALIERAADARRDDDLDTASETLRSALRLWRGPALADLAEEPFAHGISTRLESRHSAAREDYLDIELMRGRHQDVVSELEALVATHPTRERLWALLMLALYRSGRQADALGAYQRARSHLDEQLGIEPTAELRQLEQAILKQSAELDAPEVPATDTTIKWVPTVARAWLESTRGERLELRVEPLLIGRTNSAELTLHDPRVSRRHAIIRPLADGYAIEDLGSTNGSQVNGELLSPHQLRPLTDGDRIDIGATTWSFSMPLAGEQPGRTGL